VVILGKTTCSFNGRVTVSGIRFRTNGANSCLDFTGVNSSVIAFYNCGISALSNTAVTMNAANFDVAFNYCFFFSTSNNRYFSITTILSCTLFCCNTESTTGASTIAAGVLNIFHSLFVSAVTTSATGILNAQNSLLKNPTNATFLTTAGTGGSFIHLSTIASGSASAISIGSGSGCTLNQSYITSTNTNPITGAGTLTLGENTFSSQPTLNTTTINDAFIGRVNTFTPTLSFGGGSTGITYSSQIGKYWRIGSMIFFNITINLTNKGSSTGVAKVNGLPYTVANDGFRNLAVMESNMTTLPTGATALVGEIIANSTDITIVGYGASTQVAASNTNFGNTTVMTLSGFYWTS
jgi:hypothetical protein